MEDQPVLNILLFYSSGGCVNISPVLKPAALQRDD